MMVRNEGKELLVTEAFQINRRVMGGASMPRFRIIARSSREACARS
jgi:hypothetical protein